MIPSSWLYFRSEASIEWIFLIIMHINENKTVRRSCGAGIQIPAPPVHDRRDVIDADEAMLVVSYLH